VGLVPGLLVHPPVEEPVGGRVRRDVGLAGEVDAAGDPLFGGDGLADEPLGLVAEGRDEGQEVAPPIVVLL
jgi:hypothetical protein